MQTDCTDEVRWPHVPDKYHESCDDLKNSIIINDMPLEMFKPNEKNPHNAEIIPQLLVPDVAECWPHCPIE
jgi:hypothetical protein